MKLQTTPKMITITKGLNPARGQPITIFFNGEDVSYKCREARVPEEAGVEGDGWVELRWNADAAPERINGRTMWQEG